MKKLFILLVVPVTLLVTAITMYSLNIYTPWQKDHAFQNEDKLKQDIYNALSNSELRLQFKDEDVTILKRDFAVPTLTIDKQSFLKWLRGDSPNVNVSWCVDSAKLSDFLHNLYQEPEIASVSVSSNGSIVLKESSNVMSFDTDKALACILKNYVQNDINLKDTEILPAVQTVDVIDTYDKLKWLNDFSISYTSGAAILGTSLTQYLKNDELKIPDEFYEEFLDSIDHVYDTSGKTVDFKTHTGKVIQIKYNTYGEHLWHDKETEFIKEAIKEKKSIEDRVPYTYGFDDLNGTYIEVDKTNQHVYHYIKNKLCCDSPCVTGTKGVHDTPTGVFYVSECVPGKYLVGDTYRTWVNRWMRLTNTGVGFHDASWRGSFGGQIYISNGSHGCINLPSSYAYSLFDEIEPGIAVFVYDK